MEFRQRETFAFLFVCVSVLFVMSLGPGIYGRAFEAGYNIQHQLFGFLCHQQAERSYSIDGVQMAVCSRCLGIYSSLLIGLILMPVLSYSGKCSSKWLKYIFLISLALNGLDVITNNFGIWTNTLISRFFLGSFIGLSAMTMISNEFFSINFKSETSYGTGKHT